MSVRYEPACRATFGPYVPNSGGKTYRPTGNLATPCPSASALPPAPPAGCTLGLSVPPYSIFSSPDIMAE
jgi:hypothetical protein